MPLMARSLLQWAEYTESGLRCCLSWCAGRGLGPLAAGPHPELYTRWMREIRRFKPATGFTPLLGDVGRVPPWRECHTPVECWLVPGARCEEARDAQH